MPNYKIIGGDQKQYGPISADALREWIAEGRLNGQSQVLAEGAAEWRPLSSFPEFADALGAQRRPSVSAVPVNVAELTNQILAREPELRLGQCLASGWSFFASNAGFVFSAVFIVWLLKVVLMVAGIIHLLIAGVLTGGLYLACLRRMRGEPAGVGNVFDGFKLSFVQLMLAGALTQLLIQFGLLFCILPGIYLVVAWLFALPLVADKRLEFWSAMELSRKVVTRVWFEVFLLLLIVFLPFIAVQVFSSFKITTYVIGMLREADFDMLRWAASLQQNLGHLLLMSFKWAFLVQVVMLVNSMFAVGAVLRAYENLFG